MTCDPIRLLGALSLVAGLAASPGAVAQTVQWTAASGFGQGIARSQPAGPGDDRGKPGLAIDASGDVVAVGARFDGFAGTMLATKYSGIDGSVRWQRVFGGPTNSSSEAQAVAIAANGDVIVAGIAGSPAGDRFMVFRYAGVTGATVWEWESPLASGSRAYGVVRAAIDTAGDAIVAGTVVDSSFEFRMHAFKLAGGTGTLSWSSSTTGEVGALALDAVGNAFLTGTAVVTSIDIKTVKFASANGATAWERIFDGGDTYDQVFGITVDPAGNALVAGVVNSRPLASPLTIKYAGTDGTRLWETRMPGAGSDDRFVAIASDSSGNVIATGTSRVAGIPRARTVKLAFANGAVQWERFSDLAGTYDRARAVALDAAGNPVVVGMMAATGSPLGDYRTLKYAAADGATLWDRIHDLSSGDSDEAFAVAVDAGGAAMVMGLSGSGLTLALKVAKVAPDGSLGWVASPAADILAASIAPGPKTSLARGLGGAIFVTGTQQSLDAVTVKHDGTTGAQAWQAIGLADGSTGSEGFGVIVASDGNPVVTGKARGLPTTSLTMATRKFSEADGSAIWSSTGFGFALPDFATSISSSSDGSIVVAGSSNLPSGQASVIQKYDPTGRVMWGTVLSQFPYQGGTAVNALPDAGGHVVASGPSSAGSETFATAKFNAVTGTVLWKALFAVPRSPYPLAHYSMILDGAGDAIVGGRVLHDFVEERRLVKYDAADGHEKWHRAYVGPPLSEMATGMAALDPSGNYFLTGRYADDIVVAKFAGSDGALLWVATYDGPAHGADSPNDIAIDAAGNAVVTGSSHNGRHDEMLTLKFAGATGTLIWQHRHRPGRYGVGSAVVTAPGAIFVAGTCHEPGRTVGICLVRLLNRSTVQVSLAAPARSVRGTPVTFDATGTFAQDPSASADGIYTFRDGNAVICTGVSRTCTTSSLALGAHTISVAFEGNPGSDPAQSAPFTHTVTLIPQAIVFTSVPPDPAGVGAPAYSPSAQGGASGNPVVFSIDASSTPGACALSMDQVLFTGAGTCTLNADQAGSADYEPAPRNKQVVQVAPAASVLQVVVAGASGQVFSAPAGIACPPECSASFAYTEVVTLSAVPAPGVRLGQWSGSCTGTGTCAIAMVAAKQAAATFVPENPSIAVDLRAGHYFTSVPPAGGFPRVFVGKDAVLHAIANNVGTTQANAVVASLRIPSGTSLVWLSPGCTNVGDLVTCALGSMSPGTTITRRLVVRPSAPAVLLSEVVVSSAEVDVHVVNNKAPIEMMVDPSPAAIQVPRFRLFSPVTHEHHFTTDYYEAQFLGSQAGTWVFEPSYGGLMSNPGMYQGVTAVPYYRLYDKAKRLHHWTADPNEYYTLVEFPQFDGEAMDGWVLPVQAPGTVPLYRLRYPFATPVDGLHHWTLDAVEYAQLIAVYGWIGEGISGYLIP